MSTRFRTFTIIGFSILALLSAYFLTQLRFAFDFEQFFPEGDEDLAFFQEFIEEFETDDNFLLVGVRRAEGVFDTSFLRAFHQLTLACRQLPHVVESQSLTKIEYPLRTPFAMTTLPVLHLDNPGKLERDKERVLMDERFVHNLIAEDGKTIVIFLKTVNSIQLDQARELMAALDDLIGQFSFEETHYLGRPYFQKEMVAMQQREIMVSALVSGILVSLIMFFLFRRPWGIGVALFSIGLGMLLFMGYMGSFGRPLNAMAALYPVLMIIVGTSDVIHIMSKYIDELRKGHNRRDAIRTTVKEIGLATLLTSVTTAVGFATLLTSRIGPIKGFGLNAAVGVLIAYVTVILFTSAVLTWFRIDQIIKLGNAQAFWERLMRNTYQFTLRHPRKIVWGSLVFLVVSLVGISLISTNYNIISNLPRGEKITEDFVFFEKELTGFRPMELAIFAQGDHKVTDFEVLQEMEKIENYLHEQPFLQAIASITTVYKSINQMYNNNNPEAYRLPDTKARFARYEKMAKQLPEQNVNVLVSKDQKKARITSRIGDIGADSIKRFTQRMDQWISINVDSSLVRVKRTGTGLIIDKNAEYIRRNLLQGLGMAILIVSLLMVLLFRNLKMLIISLIPNIFPLLLAGALLGYLSIELEAGVSIVFAVIFGIAVDDTIHFLSKYKLARNKGLGVEAALEVTFVETGKAIVLTTIILFFGFLVMLFSIHPPSVVVGLLISVTLFSALIGDLLLIPILIRWLMNDPDGGAQKTEAPITVDDPKPVTSQEF